jgi:trehalose 6-phosphate phosphatase
MHHILAKRHSHKLAEFASSNVLLAFDYDGTLAPIVERPSLARMRPATRRLLAAVARRYPCVVISGRARQDLARRVGGVPVWHLSGNYGLEPWAQDAAYPPQVNEWVRQLERTLPAHQGITIENKTYSVTLHYRLAKHQRRAVKAIKQAISALRGARTLGGKHAISLVPRDAPSKGIALERARRLLACDTAIYVGDDDTDEEAFKAGRSDRLLGIRIGARARSRARYHLKDQDEIDDFLKTLIEFRPLRGAIHGPHFRNGR